MNITRAEAEMLALRSSLPVVEGWQGGALTVFVPGTPTNMKNKVGHWSKRAKWAKGWREQTSSRLYLMMNAHPQNHWPPQIPKRVTFTIYGRARFDNDNAALVASPCRDSLQDMKIIDNDGNPAHVFVYEQAKPSRKAGAVTGIALRIELA